MKWECARTCRTHERHDWCRFNPALAALTDITVNSHTTTVKVKLRPGSALEAAIRALGGTVLGVGQHKLFQGMCYGLGFNLPGWRYPLVLQEDGTLQYDDYNGNWGNVQDIAKLEGVFAVEAAVEQAQQLGWMVERNGQEAILYHPSGGTLRVTPDGVVDASGFVGQACHEAAAPIVAAIGQAGIVTMKPEGTCLRISQKGG